jgi:hypothetical protein
VDFGIVRTVWGGFVLGRQDSFEAAARMNGFQIWVGNVSLPSGTTWDQQNLLLCFTDTTFESSRYLFTGQTYSCNAVVWGQYAYVTVTANTFFNAAEFEFYSYACDAKRSPLA